MYEVIVAPTATRAFTISRIIIATYWWKECVGYAYRTHVGRVIVGINVHIEIVISLRDMKIGNYIYIVLGIMQLYTIIEQQPRWLDQLREWTCRKVGPFQTFL